MTLVNKEITEATLIKKHINKLIIKLKRFNT